MNHKRQNETKGLELRDCPGERLFPSAYIASAVSGVGATKFDVSNIPANPYYGGGSGKLGLQDHVSIQEYASIAVIQGLLQK